MKSLLRILVLTLLMLPLHAPEVLPQAAGMCPGVNFFPRALGYQQLTVDGTARSFTLPAGRTVRLAVAVVETNPIRYRDDGTAPTASVGTPVDPKNTIYICSGSVASFQAIRTGSSAVLNIHYYGD